MLKLKDISLTYGVCEVLPANQFERKNTLSCALERYNRNYFSHLLSVKGVVLKFQISTLSSISNRQPIAKREEEINGNAGKIRVKEVVSNYCALAMAVKVQRVPGSALVRSPATPEAEATINIPRRQHARRLFFSNCFRIQIHRIQVRMLFVCLLLISLLGEFLYYSSSFVMCV